MSDNESDQASVSSGDEPTGEDPDGTIDVASDTAELTKRNAPYNETENTDNTSTIESPDVSYTIDNDGVNLSESVAVHKEVGESEFDYVLVGSDPDNDGDDLIPFGFHEDELPIPVGDLDE